MWVPVAAGFACKRMVVSFRAHRSVPPLHPEVACPGKSPTSIHTHLGRPGDGRVHKVEGEGCEGEVRGLHHLLQHPGQLFRLQGRAVREGQSHVLYGPPSPPEQGQRTGQLALLLLFTPRRQRRGGRGLACCCCAPLAGAAGAAAAGTPSAGPPAATPKQDGDVVWQGRGLVGSHACCTGGAPQFLWWPHARGKDEAFAPVLHPDAWCHRPWRNGHEHHGGRRLRMLVLVRPKHLEADPAGQLGVCQRPELLVCCSQSSLGCRAQVGPHALPQELLGQGKQQGMEVLRLAWGCCWAWAWGWLACCRWSTPSCSPCCTTSSASGSRSSLPHAMQVAGRFLDLRLRTVRTGVERRWAHAGADVTGLAAPCTSTGTSRCVMSARMGPQAPWLHPPKASW